MQRDASTTSRVELTAAFAALAGSFSEPIVLLGTEGELLSANVAARAVLGLEGGIRGSLFDRVTPASREALHAYLRRVTATDAVLPGLLQCVGARGGVRRIRAEAWSFRVPGSPAPAGVVLRCRTTQREASRFLALNRQIEEFNAEIRRLQRVEGELEFLARAAQELSNWLDHRTTLEHLARLSVTTISEGCIIVVSDDDGLQPAAIAHRDPAKETLMTALYSRYPIEPDDGSTLSRVVGSGVAEVFGPADPPRFGGRGRDALHIGLLRMLDVRAGVVAPLVARGNTIGALALITADADRDFTPDLPFLAQLAEHCALSVDNALLFEAAGQAAERTAKLQAITAALSRAVTPREVAATVVRESVDAVGARAALAGLRTADGEGYELMAQHGYPPGQLDEYLETPFSVPGPLTDAIAQGSPVWIADGRERVAAYPTATWQVLNTAYAALPLTVGVETVGGLFFAFPHPRSFSEADRAFMLAIASLCAQALERARLYEGEERARREAETAAALREEFLSVATHELRTPVTSISGYAQLAARALDSTAPELGRVRKMLRTLVGQSTRLSTLISQLLDVSRIQKGQLSYDPVPTDVGLLVSNLVEEMRLRTAAHTWDVNVDTNVFALVDPPRIEQVVTNLLDNAIKYSPNGGRIEVRLRRDGDRARLEVADEGIGIPEEARARVFQRFGRAAGANYAGLGLGLYISKQIVDRHGGTIGFAHEPSGGTRFTVTLPARIAGRVEAVAPSAPERPPREAQRAPRRATILLVEDDRGIRDLVGELLRESGYEVLEAPNGRAALSLLERVRPDLILLDKLMPEMDGTTFAREYHARPVSHAPIIGLCAAREARDWGAHIGAVATIAKPFEIADLLAEVGRHVPAESLAS